MKRLKKKYFKVVSVQRAVELFRHQDILLDIVSCYLVNGLSSGVSCVIV